MDKKGQALVEFVIILPIFLLLLFTVIDFGRILVTRISLENKLNDVVAMYESDKEFKEIEEFIKQNDNSISLKVENEDSRSINFYVTSELEIITPGLNLALKNPYKIEVSRRVYNAE